MRDTDNIDFCYVCQEALAQAICQKVGIKFDDKQYHEQNPINPDLKKTKDDYINYLENDIKKFVDGMFENAEDSKKRGKDTSSIDQEIQKYIIWLERPDFLIAYGEKARNRMIKLARDFRVRLFN
jgi:hypothetical protein